MCAALETAERARGIAAKDNVLLDEARRTGGLGGMREVPQIDAMARKITGTPLDAALDASELVDVMLGALHVRQEAGERACLVLCVQGRYVQCISTCACGRVCVCVCACASTSVFVRTHLRRWCVGVCVCA